MHPFYFIHIKRCGSVAALLNSVLEHEQLNKMENMKKLPNRTYQSIDIWLSFRIFD